MLEYNPAFRPSAEQLLQLPVFDPVRTTSMDNCLCKGFDDFHLEEKPYALDSDDPFVWKENQCASDALIYYTDLIKESAELFKPDAYE